MQANFSRMRASRRIPGPKTITTESSSLYDRAERSIVRWTACGGVPPGSNSALTFGPVFAIIEGESKGSVCADVAQWQSSCFVNSGSAVRIRSSAST